MKILVRFFSVALALFMLCSAAASADDVLLPEVLTEHADFYNVAELDNIDRVQNQVAAYEAEIDMYELPDIDVYVFENDEESLAVYAALEAELFGAVARPIAQGERTVWTYVSAELYDDEWFIVRNDISEMNDEKLEEICWYYRTAAYDVANTGLTLHLPLLYTETEPADTDNGVVRSFVRDELAGENVTGNPIRIDFIRKTTPEGLGTDDVILDYATRSGSMTEIVTVNGRVYHKIIGNVTDENGQKFYSVLYIFQAEEDIAGIHFLYEAKANGADLAMMETSGF